MWLYLHGKPVHWSTVDGRASDCILNEATWLSFLVFFFLFMQLCLSCFDGWLVVQDSASSFLQVHSSIRPGNSTCDVMATGWSLQLWV
jgi:hypothetical protein